MHRVILVSFVLSVIAVSFTLAHGAGSKTLIRGAALILTMDPREGVGELGVIENADILLDGDKIAEVKICRRKTLSSWMRRGRL